MTHVLQKLISPACLGFYFLSTAVPTSGLSQEGAGSASNLAGQLAAMVEDGNSLTRFRMTIQSESGAGKTSLNMQIKARRHPGKSDVLYQVLFPRDRKGESVLLSQKGTGSPGGYAFTPPAKTARSLSGSAMTESIFGSDLSYQDVIENFFRWKNQSLAGKEAIGQTACIVLESKPGSGDSTPYGTVKSWIDPAKMITMRVEKYDTGGKLIRIIETLQVSKDDRGRSVPASLAVRRPGSATVTELDGSNIRHDMEFNDEDFTPRKMSDLTFSR